MASGAEGSRTLDLLNAIRFPGVLTVPDRARKVCEIRTVCRASGTVGTRRVWSNPHRSHTAPCSIGPTRHPFVGNAEKRCPSSALSFRSASGTDRRLDRLEAEAEQVGVSDVHENPVCQDLSTDETLDALTLERRFNGYSFPNHVVGKDEPHFLLVARHVGRRRCVDVCDTNRLKIELLREPLTDDGIRGACVDHRHNSYGRGHGGTDSAKRRLSRAPDGDTHVHDRPGAVEVGEGRGEGRHLRPRGGWKRSPAASPP